MTIPSECFACESAGECTGNHPGLSPLCAVPAVSPERLSARWAENLLPFFERDVALDLAHQLGRAGAVPPEKFGAWVLGQMAEQVNHVAQWGAGTWTQQSAQSWLEEVVRGAFLRKKG